MQQHLRPWRAVMMFGMVTVGLRLLVMPAVAKLIAQVEVTGQNKCWDQDGLLTECAGTGQDGDLQAGVPFPEPRFTKNEDGTVTDNLTGLIWLKDAGCMSDPFFDPTEPEDPKGHTWKEALAAIARLNAGEDFACANYASPKIKDWRLPNIKELQSLVDLGVDLADGTARALPVGHPFVGVGQPHSFYWSSTTQKDEPYKAWGVDFDEGKTLPHFKTTAFKVTCESCGLPNAPDNCPLTIQASFSVWPVRGPVPGNRSALVEVTGQTQCWDPDDAECPIAEIECKAATGQDGAIQAGERPPFRRFFDLGDGTVRDTLTTLIWLKDMQCLTVQSWSGALSTIARLNAGEDFPCKGYGSVEHTDWRLPNVKELQSVIDFGQSGPALPAGHPFLRVRNTIYHSSTTRVWRPDDAWFVSLRIGLTAADPAEAGPTKYQGRAVWAVRGGRLRSPSTP